MTIITGFIDLFRAECPERKRKENLRRARVTLEEAEVGLEDYQAQVLKLRARIERLEGITEVKGSLNGDTRPPRSSIQAPHPGPEFKTGPARTNVGSFTAESPRMVGETMGDWAARLGHDKHATA
jgi:hypothetical protein